MAKSGFRKEFSIPKACISEEEIALDHILSFYLKPEKA